MRRTIAAVLVVLLATFGFTACGSEAETTTETTITCPTEDTKSFPLTKAVTQMGLIAVGFNQIIYKPYKAGKFNKGADGRTFTIVKAVGALAGITYLIKELNENIRASAKVCGLLAEPLAKLTNKLNGLKSELLKGNFASIAVIQGIIVSATKALGK